METDHAYYMERCLELARQGLGQVAPNPMVGCVIVHENRIIGEGYHAEYGGAHAEVNAINSVVHKELLPESTLYVNLEPCAHHGKTPPCADLIVEHRFKQVVIGGSDPYAEVSGRGIRKLRKKGIQVLEGILEPDARWLNRRFFTYHEKNRPYIILKWAQTRDGYIADEHYRSKWISNPYSRVLVHKWRSEESSIMIGTRTAVEDNPKLNAREWNGSSILRVVLDKDLNLERTRNIYDGTTETWIINSEKSDTSGMLRYVKLAFDEDLPGNILRELFKGGYQSVIIEGGAILLNSFINKDLWDEARVFTGHQYFNKGIRAPLLPVSPASTVNLENDVLDVYFRKVN